MDRRKIAAAGALVVALAVPGAAFAVDGSDQYPNDDHQYSNGDNGGTSIGNGGTGGAAEPVHRNPNFTG